jgi:hypothetical protein
MSPQRIQRRRTAGWRMPEGAVYVGRPTRWGNPFAASRHADGQWRVYENGVGEHGRFWASYATGKEARARAVELFELHIGPMGNYEYDEATLVDLRRLLAGRDLVCWCPLDQPCHADVLLELANAPQAVTA